MELAGNRTLERLWRHLEPLSRTYITLMAGSNVRRIADLHTPILQALRERDPDKAVSAYHEHFDAAGALVSETWIDHPGDGTDPARATRTPGPIAACGPDNGTRTLDLGRRIASIRPDRSLDQRP
jgi:hypothetical protein